MNFFTYFPDRFQLFSGFFTTVTTSYIGPYIGRTLPGQYNTNECLVECFFTSANDCHFAATIGTTCYIGTFKLWPIEYPSGYATTTVYINNGIRLWLCNIVSLHFYTVNPKVSLTTMYFVSFKLVSSYSPILFRACDINSSTRSTLLFNDYIEHSLATKNLPSSVWNQDHRNLFSAVQRGSEHLPAFCLQVVNWNVQPWTAR